MGSRFWLSKQAYVDNDIPFNGKKATGLAEPTANGDAATKQYVDSQISNAIQGIDAKKEVRVASFANVNIASPGANIDGVALAVDDRVLLRMQTLPKENGIYLYKGAASPMVRADDMSSWAEVPGSFVFVLEGTANAKTGWLVNTANQAGTIGTTDIPFIQFSGAGSYTGTGVIIVTGTQIALDYDPNTFEDVSGLTLKYNSIAKEHLKTDVVATNGGLVGGNGTGLSVVTDDATISKAANGALKVNDDSISNTKLANMATATIKGRTTAGAGDPEDLTAAQVRTMLNVADGSIALGSAITGYNVGTNNALAAADTLLAALGKIQGQINARLSSIAIDSIDNTKLANMANATIKGRTTAGAGDPEDLTAAQVRSLIGVGIRKVRQTLTGAVDGVNTAFVIPEAIVAGSEELFINGQLLLPVIDYTIAGTNITMLTAPGTGQDVRISYLIP